jgi:hypothetical protein
MDRPVLQNTTAQGQGAVFISVPEVESFSREKIFGTDTSKLYTMDANGSSKPELSRKEFPPGPLEKSHGRRHWITFQPGEFHLDYEALSPILLHSNLPASDTLTSLLSSQVTWRPTLLELLSLGVSLLFILDLWNICNSILMQLLPFIISVSLTGYFPPKVTTYRIHPGFSCTSEVPLYWRSRISLVTDRFGPNNILVWLKVCTSSSLRTLCIMLK